MLGWKEGWAEGLMVGDRVGAIVGWSPNVISTSAYAGLTSVLISLTQITMSFPDFLQFFNVAVRPSASAPLNEDLEKVSPFPPNTL